MPAADTVEALGLQPTYVRPSFVASRYLSILGLRKAPLALTGVKTVVEWANRQTAYHVHRGSTRARPFSAPEAVYRLAVSGSYMIPLTPQGVRLSAVAMRRMRLTTTLHPPITAQRLTLTTNRRSAYSGVGMTARRLLGDATNVAVPTAGQIYPTGVDS